MSVASTRISSAGSRGLEALTLDVVRDFGPVVSVACCHAFAGRADIVTRMGRTLAERGTPTLMIDADHTAPDFHNHFGLPATPGLLQLPGMHVDRPFMPLHEIEVGLWVLASGLEAASDRPLSGIPGVQEVIRKLASDGTVVLVAAPPPGDRDTGTHRVADPTLLVVRRGVTGKQELANAASLCRKSGTTLAGVVIAS